MTSVPNHQRPLNGSKFLTLIGFICFLILASCNGSKKAIDDARVARPSSTRKATPRQNKGGIGKVDTIRWTEIDRSKEYEKTIEDLELDKRAQYQVALLYPFGIENSNMSDANNPKSRLGRMTDYYAGTKMALEQLEQEEISLDVRVYDSESGNFDSKLQGCRNADVIIGPMDRGQLSTTAQYGLNNEIPVVSPWLSSTKVTKNNPYYIQLKPSLKRHMAKMVEHVKENYSDEQVFLLGRKKRKDQGMMKYIQNVAAAINRSGNDKTFQEFYIEEDSLINGEMAYDSIFYTDKTSVFILPNWSFVDDESFVYNAVRKMSGEKGLNDVVLYGMPILLESDKIKFEHYSNLNMRIVRTSYLDREEEAVREFRKSFFDSYQGFPSEEAYRGFDMMMFVGRSLNAYGKKFQYFLDTYESSLYQTEFDVHKVFSDSENQSLNDIEYLQNEHLYILEFKDNHFVRN